MSSAGEASAVDPAPAPPRARSVLGLFPGYGWVGLLVGVVGAVLLSQAAPAPFMVESLHLGKLPGAIALPDIFAPSLYAEVMTANETVRTEVQEKTVVGGGLTLRLGRPVALSEISRIKIRNGRFYMNGIKDQVERPARENDCGKYRITCQGGEGPGGTLRLAGLVMAWGGGGLFGIGVLVFARRQARGVVSV